MDRAVQWGEKRASKRTEMERGARRAESGERLTHFGFEPMEGGDGSAHSAPICGCTLSAIPSLLLLPCLGGNTDVGSC